MPEKTTRKAEAKDKRQGKSASTLAGEYVHEEIEHIRQGKHGARSTKQAIAIGLSKARRAGVKVPVKTSASKAARKRASRDEAAAEGHAKPSPKRSRSSLAALKKEGRKAASTSALSKHAKESAAQRSARSRSAAAKKAARTRGASARKAAAKKVAKKRVSS